MKNESLPAELIVTVSIEPNERDLLFEKPLQKWPMAENAGNISLTLTDILNGENGRYSSGFTMDLIIYDREKAISCIRKALKLISATKIQLRIYNEQTKRLEYVEL